VGSLFASLLLAVVALVPAELRLQPPPDRVVQASALVGRLASGQSVDEVGLRVEGDLSLRSVGTVARPFRCRECIFAGTIHATDVVFNSIIDLSGSILEGDVFLTGARLEAPFVIDGTQNRRSEIHGRVDLRLARFSDFASLDRTRLLGPIDATSADFTSAVSFAEAEFLSDAIFDRAQFGSSTSFAGASTEGLRMARTTFTGPAVFQQHIFHGDADFSGATFRDTADFTSAEFEAKALFDSVRFHRGASFRLVVASFASFRGAQAAGPLVLDGAIFERGLSLAGFTALDSLSLRSIHIIAKNGLELDQLSASTLLLEVPTVDHVRGVPVQEDVLSLLEQSAKSSGDLPLANDARFRRLTLQASRQGPIYRLFDRIILREIAGYLVRPFYPLRAIVFVLLLGAAVRALPTWVRRLRVPLLSALYPAIAHTDRLPSTNRSSFLVFLKALFASAHQAFTIRSGIDWQAEEAPTARMVAMGCEWLAYKGLTAIFLLGLGNSNPTMRQIIDAVAPW
jgi:uncharacterized protein YjbI with pentapeptide repeats